MMTVDKLDILIFSSEAHDISYMTHYFSPLDLKYEICTDEKEGLFLMEKKRPKIVIVDSHLSGRKGEEVAVRFSELVMFGDSSIYIIVPNQVSEKEIFLFSTLGFLGIYKKQLTESDLDEILSFNGLSSAAYLRAV